MKLYVGDYLGDTHHLGALEHGAYLLLLMSMWRAGGSLPLNDTNLARLARCSTSEWEAVRETVMAYFTKARGRISHKRLSEEIDKYDSVSGKRSEAGKEGQRQKANKIKAKPQAIASEPESNCRHNQNHNHNHNQEVVVVAVSSATDWPDAPAKDLVGVLAKLNPRIDPDRHQGFIVGVGEVARWKLAGYSWSLDVVPSIEGTTRGQPVKNWNYFSPIIAQAHASRTRPQEDHDQPDHFGTENGATVAHFPRTGGGRREPDDIVAIVRRRAAARERGEIP